jgi:hypothetical protein
MAHKPDEHRSRPKTALLDAKNLHIITNTLPAPVAVRHRKFDVTTHIGKNKSVITTFMCVMELI